MRAHWPAAGEGVPLCLGRIACIDPRIDGTAPIALCHASVLGAEWSLYLAEDQRVQSEQGISVNLVALCKVLGGGLAEGIGVLPLTPPQ